MKCMKLLKIQSGVIHAVILRQLTVVFFFNFYFLNFKLILS
jgi:hypothetical protein